MDLFFLQEFITVDCVTKDIGDYGLNCLQIINELFHVVVGWSFIFLMIILTQLLIPVTYKKLQTEDN